jgi:uncharacterized protein YfaT (DUF1175 family)
MQTNPQTHSTEIIVFSNMAQFTEAAKLAREHKVEYFRKDINRVVTPGDIHVCFVGEATRLNRFYENYYSLRGASIATVSHHTQRRHSSRKH